MQIYKHKTLCLATALTILFAIVPVATHGSLSVGVGLGALLNRANFTFRKNGVFKQYYRSKEAKSFLFNNPNDKSDEPSYNGPTVDQVTVEKLQAGFQGGQKNSDDNHMIAPDKGLGKGPNVYSEVEQLNPINWPEDIRNAHIKFANAKNAYNIFSNAAKAWKQGDSELTLSNWFGSSEDIVVNDQYDLDWARRLSLQIYSKYVEEMIDNLGVGAYMQLGWNFTEMKFKDALSDYKYNEGFFGSIGLVIRIFERLDLMVGLGVRNDSMNWTGDNFKASITNLKTDLARVAGAREEADKAVQGYVDAKTNLQANLDTLPARLQQQAAAGTNPAQAALNQPQLDAAKKYSQALNALDTPTSIPAANALASSAAQSNKELTDGINNGTYANLIDDSASGQKITSAQSDSGFALTWNLAACLYFLDIDAVRAGIVLGVAGDFTDRSFKVGPMNKIDINPGQRIDLGLVLELKL